MNWNFVEHLQVTVHLNKIMWGLLHSNGIVISSKITIINSIINNNNSNSMRDITIIIKREHNMCQKHISQDKNIDIGNTNQIQWQRFINIWVLLTQTNYTFSFRYGNQQVPTNRNYSNGCQFDKKANLVFKTYWN